MLTKVRLGSLWQGAKSVGGVADGSAGMGEQPVNLGSRGGDGLSVSPDGLARVGAMDR